MRRGGDASRSRRACARPPARKATRARPAAASPAAAMRGSRNPQSSGGLRRDAGGRNSGRLIPNGGQVPGEILGRAVSILGILGETPLHDRDEIGRSLRGQRWPAAPARLSMIAVRVCGGGGTIEGPPARRHLVEDRAERKLVRPEVDRLAARLLGRHVADGAEDRPGSVARRHRRALGAVARSRNRLPASFARPKSRILTSPSRVTIRFSGFRSRCTMPAAWALASPSADLRGDGRAAS